MIPRDPGLHDIYQGQQEQALMIRELFLTLGELRSFTEASLDTINDRFDRLEDRIDQLQASPGFYEH
jgi:hypothetical protein